MSGDDLAGRHLRACGRFGDAVAAAEGKWGRPSPCEGWDARAVVEHLIGFHDVLLLRPFGAKPVRPRDDPAARWDVTHQALEDLLARPELFAGETDIPAMGNNPRARIDVAALLPALTQDVLVHTWDLARAADADDRLDADLCEWCLARLPDDAGSLAASGMFARPVAVAAGAGAQARLLGRLGRDPAWRPA